MMGPIVMLAVGWGATELELLILALDEAVGVEVGVESCRRIIAPVAISRVRTGRMLEL
jgi:hypothetical protein